jgi:RNA recognition motif-containing protein
VQGSKLYVGNLDYSVTDEQIKELFMKHGEVQSVKLFGDRGFGFIEMAKQAEAEKAKEALNGTEFAGRTLKVDMARPRKDRGRRNY